MKKIKGEWWTDETVNAGKDGTVEVYGFRGEYRLEAGDLTGVFTLDGKIGEGAVRLG
jgi:hypothetical protein